MQATNPTSASRQTAIGPPSCQRSSQIVIATSTPWSRTMGNVSPGTKYLNSSNTP